MSHIVVSYAGADESAAGLVIGKLKKLGHTVTPAPAPKRRSRTPRLVSGGDDVLVLWSRAYANASLRPNRALAALRLDAAAPPARMKTKAIDLRQWRGREDHRGWRSVLATLPKPNTAKTAPKPAAATEPSKPAQEPAMKEALNVKEYTGPQFIHLGVMLALLGGAGAWMWQFLPH
jgi:hypothetical protein